MDRLDSHYALVRPIGRIVEVFLRIAGLERTIGPFSATLGHSTNRKHRLEAALRSLGYPYANEELLDDRPLRTRYASGTRR